MVNGVGTSNIFSTMQHTLTNKAKGRIALKKEVHNALDDFRWMHNNIATRPTRIAEIIPLLPAAEGHHDASGIGAGGVWFLGDNITPRKGYVRGNPILWQYKWPQYIVDRLITDQNPNGTISNSDLELAGGLFQLQLDVISNASMFAREQYFPKAITSQHHILGTKWQHHFNQAASPSTTTFWHTSTHPPLCTAI